jgi:hypothetical protein
MTNKKLRSYFLLKYCVPSSIYVFSVSIHFFHCELLFEGMGKRWGQLKGVRDHARGNDQLQSKFFKSSIFSLFFLKNWASTWLFWAITKIYLNSSLDFLKWPNYFQHWKFFNSKKFKRKLKLELGFKNLHLDFCTIELLWALKKNLTIKKFEWKSKFSFWFFGTQT